MKKMSLMALLVGAALFTGLGVTSALAEEGKCGAGKCGSEMKKPADGKCGAKKSDKCGAEKSGKCGDGKAMVPGKCGGEKKAEEKGKCGAGKCGK
ncbi:MAG: hypothetical protein WBF77_10690 [Sulfurimonadaceae bacterium]